MELFTALQILKPNPTNESTESKIDHETNEGLSSGQMFFGSFYIFWFGRLEAYSNNAIEFYIIKDLLQKIAELYFLGKFGAEAKVIFWLRQRFYLDLDCRMRSVENV